MPDEPNDLKPPAEGENETPTDPAAAEAEAPSGTFGMDPALAAAMAAADDSYSKRKAEAKGGLEIDDSDEGDEGEEVVIETGAPSRAPPMPTGAGEGMVRALSQLKDAGERLEKLEDEKKQLEERLLLARADLENFKKRSNREVEQERKFANEKLLKELFPVMDNMERAIDATENTTLEQYSAGLEMVEKSFVAALARFGVEQFSCLHEPFDPERMEAMQQMESAEHPPGTVIQEFMKGYLLNGRLVRPSMVVVSKAPVASSPEPVQDQAEAEEAGDGGAEGIGGAEDKDGGEA